ncbi:MAG: aminotransferase class V-fold PLP-dependent enzyme, partial [Candidatus Diapherotrites archaeon]
VSEIVSVAHDKNIPVMLDAAQSAGHVKINLKKMGADMLAFSGHKMCGPFIGALVCKKEILKRLSPLIFGGGMVEETTTKSYKIKDDYKGFEAGLQDCASILGLETACKYLEKIGFKRIENYENKLTKRLTKGLSNFQEVSFIGVAEPKNKIAIVNFVLKGTSSMDVAMLLDELGGIAVRSGMHCAHSWYKKYSLPPSVRASLYFYNTTEEVDIFLEKIEQITKIKKGKDISRTRR